MRFRKFLKPYRTRGSSFREYTIILGGVFIKTGNPLTIGQLKRWCEDNNISDDTPIGIYIGASERGDVAFGVIGDTKSEINDDFYVTNLTESTGEHCYCKNMYSLFEEANSDRVVMITDGYHSEEI